MNSKNKFLRHILALLLTLAMVLGSVGGFGSGKAVKAAGEAKLTIQASKTLDGKAPAADQFEFQILQNDSVVKTAKNDATGKVVFDALTFTAAGTYTYTVKEKVPADAVNHVKDGIQYDDTVHTVVVVVDAQGAIASVTVDGNPVSVPASGGSGSTLGGNVDVYLKGDASGNYIEVNGGGGFTDKLFNLRAGDTIVYCLDDGIQTADNTPMSYNEFDKDLAPEFSGADGAATEKLIKKLLYFGAPHDGGTGELVQWLTNYQDNYHGMTYSQAEAEEYFEFMTGALLHNITNPLQGIGFNGDNTPESEGIETYQILDQVIDKGTGEFINNAVGRNTIYDLMAQKLWQKVIDPATDSVADLVTLRLYAPDGQGSSRPDDSGSEIVYQRVIAAEIKSVSSVTVDVSFANNTVEDTEPEKVSVKVEKKWVGPKAEKALVQLKVDGQASGDPVTLNQGNSWKYTWTDLAKTKADGTEIEYTVDEPTVPANYTKTVAHDGNNWTITNTNTETVEVKATKKWVDLDGTTAVNAPAGASVTLQLYAGEEKSGETKVLDCSEKSEATVTWSGLPKYDAAGQEIQYSVKEEGFSADGFTKGEVSGNMKDGFEISNKKTAQETAPEKISVTVEKEWEGEVGDPVSVQLMKDGEPYGDAVILNAENEWTHTWTELDKTLADGTTPIDYRVEEAESDAYSLIGESVDGDDKGNLTYHLVNAIVAPETVNVTVKKNWVGEPASEISVTLTRNGEEEDTQTLKGAPWTYTWTNLPKVDEKGEAYVYFVTEAAPAGYTQTGGGYNDDGEGNITITITNTKDVTKHKVKISKVDLVSGKAVKGAEIVLMNAVKKGIETWTSGEGPKEFDLAPGKYYFQEINAPAGYIKVETAICFTVDEDGEITVNSIEVTPADAVEVKDGTIYLKNELKKEDTEPGTSEEEEEEGSSQSSEEGGTVPGGGEEEEEKPGNSEDEEEEDSTEEDEAGNLPAGGEEEEENAVNGESEEAETTPETEPVGALPAEEEEEGGNVGAETEAPRTTPATAPDTGDHSHLGLYLGLMGMAAAAGFGLLVGSRKTREEN